MAAQTHPPSADHVTSATEKAKPFPAHSAISKRQTASAASHRLRKGLLPGRWPHRNSGAETITQNTVTSLPCPAVRVQSERGERTKSSGRGEENRLNEKHSSWARQNAAMSKQSSSAPPLETSTAAKRRTGR
eukprot:scaffold2708_cov158-Ochromonas_danica.AAC.30